MADSEYTPDAGISQGGFPAVIDGNIGVETVQTVNARDLHTFLEVGKMFANWIKDRIQQYGFIEGRDFIEVVAETGKNSSGGRPAREYHISLDMAKELSMVERNEKGKQARQYFIEMERRVKSGVVAIDVRNPSQLAQIAVQLIEVNREQAIQIEGMKEDVAALDRIAKADGSLNITEAAKNLGIRPKDLFDWLSHNGWIYKRPGSSAWLGYQPKCNQGLLEHKSTTVLRADGSEKISEQVRVTAKGLTILAKLIQPTARLIAS